MTSTQSEEQFLKTLGGPKSATRDIDFCYAIPPEHRQLGERACTGRVILGDISAQAIYSFRADRFVSVAVNYRSQDFDSRILRWDGPTTAIVLRRYAGDATAGLGSITTQDEVRESRRLFREQTKGGAKDR